MHRNDAISQSDRVLVVALGIILATVSATVGSAFELLIPLTVAGVDATVTVSGDATVLVLQGFIFVSILASETLYGRIRWFQPRGAR